MNTDIIDGFISQVKNILLQSYIREKPYVDKVKDIVFRSKTVDNSYDFDKVISEMKIIDEFEKDRLFENYHYDIYYQEELDNYNLYDYKSLYIENVDNIRILDNNPNIECLFIQSSNIENIPNLPNLKLLYCIDNLNILSIQFIPKLTELYLSGCSNIICLKNIPNVQKMYISDTKLTYIYKFPNLKELHLNNNLIDSIYNCHKLDVLTVSFDNKVYLIAKVVNIDNVNQQLKKLKSQFI